MKQYVSNRIREAFKIESVSYVCDDIFVVGGDGEQVEVSEAYINKHDPKKGGYYVRYLDDGYESFCPAGVFEVGNVEVGDTPPPEDTGIDAVILPNESFSGDVVGVSREDESTEAMIAAAGLNAPRVVPDKLVERIDSVAFYRLTDTLTVAVVSLVNGFTVTGESACASPENFNWEIGKKIALEEAVRKIWPLEGYLLKQHLYDRRDVGTCGRQAG